jgi:hypothetical protein
MEITLHRKKKKAGVEGGRNVGKQGRLQSVYVEHFPFILIGVGLTM